MFNKANVVGILIKAKKHGLVFFDGEIVFAVSSWLRRDSLAVCAFDACGLCAVQWLLLCSFSSIRLIRLIRLIRFIRLMRLMFVDYVLFSDSSSVQSVRSEDDDEFVVLQKPIGEIRRAFGEMRDRWEPIFKDFESILNFDQVWILNQFWLLIFPRFRHSDMFEFDPKRRATICLPEDSYRWIPLWNWARQQFP